MKNVSDKSVVLWAGYISLLLFILAMYFQFLALFGTVVLIGGYLARHLFRKHGQIFNAAHASWQINTVWLTLLLAILAVVAVIAIGAWMDNEPSLEARLDAIINSDLAPIDGLRAIWNIPGVSTLVTTIIIFAMLCLIWPLKRVLHGMMALRYGLEPAQLGARWRWLALALAVTLQVLPMLVFVLL